MYLHVVAYFLVCGFVLPFPSVIFSFFFFFLRALQIFVQLLLIVRFAMPHLNFYQYELLVELSAVPCLQATSVKCL